MGSIVISIRVPRTLHEKLKKYNVNVSRVVRELLERYVWELELKALADELDSVKRDIGSRVDKELVLKIIRETREER